MTTKRTTGGWSGAPSASDLQQQYATLQDQVAHGGPTGSFSGQLYLDARNQLDALRNRIGAMQPAPGPDRITQDRKDILGYTAGRGDATLNDAMTNQALQRLDSVSSGKDAPYTDAVQNQMMARYAGGTATAMGSQADMLRQQAAAGGGNLADPSYQARLRQLNAQRTSQNLTNQGDVRSNAQLQNFGARQQATNGLLNGRFAQMGMANSQYNAAADFLRNDSQSGGHVNSAQQPVYNFYGNGFQTPGVRPYPGQAQTSSGATQQQAVQPQQPYQGSVLGDGTYNFQIQQPIAHADNEGYIQTNQTPYQAPGYIGVNGQRPPRPVLTDSLVNPYRFN